MFKPYNNGRVKIDSVGWTDFRNAYTDVFLFKPDELRRYKFNDIQEIQVDKKVFYIFL